MPQLCCAVNGRFISVDRGLGFATVCGTPAGTRTCTTRRPMDSRRESPEWAWGGGQGQISVANACPTRSLVIGRLMTSLVLRGGRAGAGSLLPHHSPAHNPNHRISPPTSMGITCYSFRCLWRPRGFTLLRSRSKSCLFEPTSYLSPCFCRIAAAALWRRS